MEFLIPTFGLSIIQTFKLYNIQKIYENGFRDIKDAPLYDFNHINKLDAMKRKKIFGVRINLNKDMIITSSKNIFDKLDTTFDQYVLSDSDQKLSSHYDNQFQINPRINPQEIILKENDVTLQIDFNNVKLAQNFIDKKSSKIGLLNQNLQGLSNKGQQIMIFGNINKKNNVLNAKYLCHGKEGFLIGCDRKYVMITRKNNILMAVSAGIIFLSTLLNKNKKSISN